MTDFFKHPDFMKFPNKYFILSILILAGASAKAGTDEKTAFKITPTGRALFDAAAYLPQDDDFKPGVTVPDVRLGAKATFGDFEARADISYRFGKLYPADIYLKWAINEKSFLKGGFFVHQFGLHSANPVCSEQCMSTMTSQYISQDRSMPRATQ